MNYKTLSKIYLVYRMIVIHLLQIQKNKNFIILIEELVIC